MPAVAYTLYLARIVSWLAVDFFLWLSSQGQNFGVFCLVFLVRCTTYYFMFIRRLMSSDHGLAGLETRLIQRRLAEDWKIFYLPFEKCLPTVLML